MTKALNRSESDGQGRPYWWYECCVSGDRKLYYSKKIYDKSVELHLAKCQRCKDAQWNSCIDTLHIPGMVTPRPIRIQTTDAPTIESSNLFTFPRRNIESGI
jgi:hypothetical protein